MTFSPSYSVAETSPTPRVLFDAVEGKFSLFGVSHPEDTQAFYDPIQSWFEEYKACVQAKRIAVPSHLELELKFRFLSTSSLRSIGWICRAFAQLSAYAKCSIYWRYEPGDIDIRDMGEDMFTLLALPVDTFVEELSAPIDMRSF